MSRLLLFFVFALIASLFCVAVIKAVIVYMAEIFYGGSYQWSVEDLHFILIRGGIMGLVFCVFGIARFIKMKK